ncbi:hypothetical protein [Streptomyces sp. ICBB 8177]|uniref:hypothetical protein n=1 Tax=Streptomyces sp. ICBB 8177 TaxID=563922 RepID=UPI00130542E4|nr:hypothetical protein [Streptomyces sp. ICBB 8177]
MTVAACCAALAGWAAARVLSGGAVGRLAVGACVMGVLFLLVARALRVGELRSLRTVLR